VNEKLYGVPLATSLLLHGLLVVFAAALVRHGSLPRQDFLPVSLVEAAPANESETIAQANKSIVTREVKSTEAKSEVKNAAVNRQILPTVGDEDNKTAETKSNQASVSDTLVIASKPRLESGAAKRAFLTHRVKATLWH